MLSLEVTYLDNGKERTDFITQPVEKIYFGWGKNGFFVLKMLLGNGDIEEFDIDDVLTIK